MKKWILLAMAAGLACAQAPAPVKVAEGTVQGATEDGLAVYRGIPFAKPPVGDLRWRAPLPAEKWDGVKQTVKFAPACYQSGRQTAGVGEDCLYLNVWSPAKTAKDKVPVLVWIYGGGFGAGATSEANYSGEKLAKKGVVLVSIAYRVGQMGFFAHPELSAENPHKVSGNYGLLDMIAGLQWIQKNIEQFGGDPKKVTIFGESAGGIAVSMLSASPLAKGLFVGAISQSGGNFGPPRASSPPGENQKRLADAEAAGVAALKAAGAANIAEARKLTPDKFASAGFGGGMAWPNMDGYVIPDDQFKMYSAGKFNDTNILVGYNSDEGQSFSPPRTPEAYIDGVKSRYGKFADKLIAAYPVTDGKVGKTARDLARDSAFGWQTWAWARLQTEKGKGKAYLYYFDQHPEYAADSPRAGYGTPHGADVPYVFLHVNLNSPQALKSDAAISEAMATYWTNFAKTGNPNGAGVPNWPAFSSASPQTMIFHDVPKAGPVPSEASMKVLDEYFAWRRTPEGASAVK